MSSDLLLLTLRIVIALALYVFLGALFVIIWHDVQAASQQGATIRLASARLIIVEADEDLPLEVGHALTFQSLATIGRSPTSTVVLPDTFASTDHARITQRRGQWWLEDLDSRNGTTINDVAINEAVVLSSNDIIGIGRVKLRFESG